MKTTNQSTQPDFVNGVHGPMNRTTYNALQELTAIERAKRGLSDDPAACDDTGRAMPRAIVTCAADIEIEPIDWLWTGWLARSKIHVMDGDPGTSKSTLAYTIGAIVSCGGRMPDGAAIDPGPVLILSAEDGAADTIVPRLTAARADLRRCHIVTGMEEAGAWRPITFPDDVEHLRKLVDDTGAALVILDPLSAFLSGARKMNGDQDVRQALHPLQNIGEDTGAAFLIVRHLSKGSLGGSALYRGTGSIGIVGAARLAWTVAVDPDDNHEDVNARRRVMAVSKSNIGRIPDAWTYVLEEDVRLNVPAIRFVGSTKQTADDLVRPSSQIADRGPTAEDRACEIITEILSGGPIRATDLEEQARRHGNIGRDAYKKARASLHSDGAIHSYPEGFPAVTWWKLSDSANTTSTPVHTGKFAKSPRQDGCTGQDLPQQPDPADDWPEPESPGFRLDGPTRYRTI